MRTPFARLRLQGPTPVPAHEYVMVGFCGRFMAAAGWGGFTLPLPFLPCVILYWAEVHPACRVHEFKHVEQRLRLGFMRFVLTYVWGLRRGYRNNPLEVEAYATCGEQEPAWARDFSLQ